MLDSNLNLNDPGIFYKSWLLEIHKKDRDRKGNKITSNKSLNERLDMFVEMLNTKIK
jgi:hypothetical protein